MDLVQSSASSGSKRYLMRLVCFAKLRRIAGLSSPHARVLRLVLREQPFIRYLHKDSPLSLRGWRGNAARYTVSTTAKAADPGLKRSARAKQRVRTHARSKVAVQGHESRSEGPVCQVRAQPVNVPFKCPAYVCKLESLE